MFTDDDLLPISALQHLLFCERQCALIHIEGHWQENVLTVEGEQLHEKVHSQEGETRKEVRIAYSLPLYSRNLGLIGKADAVEFQLTDGDTAQGVQFKHLPGLPAALKKGHWLPFPIEYKRGKPKIERCDEVQVCAQAICLEEMLGAAVPGGALFYGKTHRRHDVTFDAALREETKSAAIRLHELLSSGITPRAEYAKRCEQCSLAEVCLPRFTSGKKSARQYLHSLLNQ